jgi:hypothetical protein
MIKLLPDAWELSQSNLIYFCNILYDANYYLERFGSKTQDVLGERKQMISIRLDQFKFKQVVDDKLS